MESNVRSLAAASTWPSSSNLTLDGILRLDLFTAPSWHLDNVSHVRPWIGCAGCDSHSPKSRTGIGSNSSNKQPSASSPSVPVNLGSIDWSGHGRSSKAGSLSGAGSHWPRACFSTSAGNSALGASQPLCRPWERSDLLRRLASFKPSNWFCKPKVAGSLACACRGWVSVDIDKIACESCGAHLTFICSSVWTPSEVDSAAEAFAKQLDASHKGSCPWKGNSCTESLAQFPPTLTSALIGGYKDRCDALLQFPSLPVIASSAIEHMRLSRSSQIDRLLSHAHRSTAGDVSGRVDSMPVGETSQDETMYIYAQKLISLCGWESRWLPNVVDYEEHSTQSARNACSVGPSQDHVCYSQGPVPSKNVISTSAKKDTGKKKLSVPESGCHSRLALLDCSFCGATVRLWDFLSVPRPTRIGPNIIDIPETSKKLVLTRGTSAASGINGWVGVDGIDKEQAEGRDEIGMTEAGRSATSIGLLDLNLTMAGGPSPGRSGMPSTFNKMQGHDLVVAQPAGSEVGDRAASYESRGPCTRKRSLDEGGSTVDRPHRRTHHADSFEGTVIDRDGDEVDDGRQYSDGPSKHVRDSDAFCTYPTSYTSAAPSHFMGFDLDAEVNKVDYSRQEGSEQMAAPPSTRDSARASSVIAMDTVCHDAEENSMESVENHPADLDDIHLIPQNIDRNLDANDISELNISLQAQQSTCFQPESERAVRETRVSSTDEGEETLNAENITGHGRDRLSFGISGGSVGMVASHEAEICGIDFSVHRTESIVGDPEPVAEVVENLGQTGESIPDPGLMDEFVPDAERDVVLGDSHDVMSHSNGRADSGSKIDCSTKAESLESGEKANHMFLHQNSGQNSLTYNAIIYSGYEVSKGEVTQAMKASHTVKQNTLHES
ncbi:NIPA-like protein [Nymphaea thermarum]|nr:NIPA-like protein [Nymphaea thermarum]